MAAEASSSVDSGESAYWCWTYHSSNKATVDQERLYYSFYPEKLATYSNFGGRGKTELKVLYTVAQEEQCPTTGRVHLQGYVEFNRRVKRTTLSNIFNPAIHWEKRRGNSEQARDYCSKEDTRVPGGRHWELGERSKVTGSGQRSDLDSLAADMKQGMKRKAIADKHSAAFIKYSRGIEEFANAMDLDLEEKCPTYTDRLVYIFYGPSGSGKSTAAEHKMDGDSVYRPQKNNSSVLSFETYRGEKWIFLDDFEPTMINKGTLKEICDNRKCILPGRGSNSGRVGRHKGVIITSNIDPEEWYDKPDAKYKVHFDALARRSQAVWRCGDLENGEPTADWVFIRGLQEDFKPGEVVASPLPQLIEWARNKQQMEEHDAIVDALASNSTGHPNRSAAAAASSSASSPTAAVDLTQDEE